MTKTMTPKLTSVEAARLRLVVMRLARRVRKQAAGGITPSQLSVLATINRCGPLSLGALATAEEIAPPTVTRIVTALERMGLLVRRPDPHDRRSALIALTDAGNRRVTELRRRRDAWFADAVSRLEPRDAEALAAAVPALERLVDSL